MFTSAVWLTIALSAAPEGALPEDGGVVALPPVDVALPPVVNDPLPTSPVVRDPSATLTTRDATQARAEAKDASELLSTTPGSVVQDSGGIGQRKTISLRGAASNAVLVLLDGVPLAGPGAAIARFGSGPRG